MEALGKSAKVNTEFRGVLSFLCQGKIPYMGPRESGIYIH